jgi:hypothetical protein
MFSRSKKSLAVPVNGRVPSFEEVTGIIKLAVGFDLSVCVLCLNQPVLERWIDWSEEQTEPITLLDILNNNQATLSDWKDFLRNQSYDLTVLAGVKTELEAKRLSAGYVEALVKAVPSGLVMVI